ncbi:hypothetical protein ACVMB0_005543 [Bradyrhizobium sp. USDA 4451]
MCLQGVAVRTRRATQQNLSITVCENISLYPKRNSVYEFPVSPDTRGASRSSRTRVEMRWTPNAQLTNAHEADGEIVQA